MDIKFVVILLFVELITFGFVCWRFTKGNLTVYNHYDNKSVIHNISNVNYQCFAQMNHCHYNNLDLFDLNIFNVIFAGIGLLGYIALTILLCTNKTAKTITRSKIRLGNIARLTILMVTALNSLLIVIYYKIEARLIEKCSLASRNVRLESMASYLIINTIEVAYLLFDFNIEDNVVDHIDQNETKSLNTHTVEIPLVPIEHQREIY